MNLKPNTSFSFDLDAFIEKRTSVGLTILCGPNNSGKTFFMNSLTEKTGENSYILAVQRYYNANQFSSSNIDPNRKTNIYRNILGNFHNDSVNNEKNHFDLNRIISDMVDTNRTKLFKICEKILGENIKLVDLQEGNKFSPSYVSVNGSNLSFASAGTRLLLTLIGTLIYDIYDTFYIDEPELGLSPKIQFDIANFLYDLKNRKKYFPHIKNLFISTHSHIFLDRNNINNNFEVSKTDNVITLKQINSMSSFHSLQFNLLGNTFESLYLPSLIVIVEGKTDYNFIKRSLEIIFPKNKITVIPTNSDGEIIRELIHLQNVLHDVEKSPYRDRIFVVLDKNLSSPTIVGDIEKRKIPKKHIIQWENNGIEYVYPVEIMRTIYSCGKDDVRNISIENDDNVTFNNITFKKSDLCDEVVKMLNKDTKFPSEFNTKFINQIEEVLF